MTSSPDDHTCGTPHRWTVTEDQAGERLDKWLAEVSDFSRSRLQALIAEGQVTVMGQGVTTPKHKVQAGDEIVLIVPPVAPANPTAQDIPLDVVFEDAHLIVINKPAGLSMHPGAGQPDGTVVNALLHHCAGSLSGIGGIERPGIVHRLDKDTSGIVVCAKTDQAHQALSAQFAARTTKRLYHAVVRGVPKHDGGKITTHLARSRFNRQKMAVVSEAAGKLAITNYDTQEVYGAGQNADAALLHCHLETGRTHQIRVHMAHVGHPLLGDPVYGSGHPSRAVQQVLAQTGFARQALHAARLGFVHPESGKPLEFHRHPPQDMQDLITALQSL